MTAFVRTIHALAVSLWFGSVAFFTVAGLLVFGAFERVSQDEGERAWFPVAPQYDKAPPEGSKFPDPLRKEQGSRAAGVAVGAIFPTYYALQAGCGLVAMLAAFALLRAEGGRLNRARFFVCVLGLLTVKLGWWLERKVHDLGVTRHQTADVMLRAATPTEGQVTEAREARAAFFAWHGVSLLVNFATLGLSLVAAGMVPFRPDVAPPRA